MEALAQGSDEVEGSRALLELDRIAPCLRSRVNELPSHVQRSVVVHARLGGYVDAHSALPPCCQPFAQFKESRAKEEATLFRDLFRANAFQHRLPLHSFGV